MPLAWWSCFPCFRPAQHGGSCDTAETPVHFIARPCRAIPNRVANLRHSPQPYRHRASKRPGGSVPRKRRTALGCHHRRSGWAWRSVPAKYCLQPWLSGAFDSDGRLRQEIGSSAVSMPRLVIFAAGRSNQPLCLPVIRLGKLDHQ